MAATPRVFPPRPQSRAAWADAALRAAILRGELAPGQRLRAAEVAEELALSPTPVREAFARLAGEGLVELLPQRGARVAPVSFEDALDLYELRLLVEPEAVRRSVEHGDAAWLSTLDTAHRALVEPAADLAELLERHRAFHRVLVAACPSSRLRDLVDELGTHAQRYAALGAQREEGHAAAADEHDRLVRAAAGGDGDAAAAVVRVHLGHTLDAVRSRVQRT